VRGGTLDPMHAQDQQPAARKSGLRDRFNRIADALTRALGSPWALMIAAGVIVVWIVTGPLFGFSDTWQLLINTGTTIVTFLMVFVIQNTQNRGAKAVHAKLDELIRATEQARDRFVLAEDESEEELDRDMTALRAIGDGSADMTAMADPSSSEPQERPSAS
jgi:low affinity Fe/Cu permease